MASRTNTTKMNPSTSNAASPLCDYCRQKPKFGGYQYCSKTCAKQVSTLCNHCHKKPKFGNFEYCGKNCAAAAGSNGAGSGQPRNNANPRSNKPPANTGAAITINPSQIAQLVAQQMPQVQALLANAAAGAAGAALASAVAGGTSAAPARSTNAPIQPQARANQGPTARAPAAPKAPVNNPFINSMKASSGNAPAASNPIATTLPALDPDDDDSDEMEPDEEDDLPECLIPGCEKPIHVDPNGSKASQYCSKKHREEAVADGLVPACIMCLTMPQSEADYFCGRVCREEAMSKAAELST